MKKQNCNWGCPRCQKRTYDFPAISRRDNNTEICSQCGVDEAMADYYGKEDNWLDKAGPSKEYQAHFDNFYNNGKD